MDSHKNKTIFSLWKETAPQSGGMAGFFCFLVFVFFLIMGFTDNNESIECKLSHSTHLLRLLMFIGSNACFRS